ncbi:MAG: hypothetical protein ABSA46_18825 [Thermodesulfovibrionales bacterium]|jgi:DNA-binding transcriptional regulator YiaG
MEIYRPHEFAELTGKSVQTLERWGQGADTESPQVQDEQKV